LPANYSVWVFLLLGIEAIRTYRANPHLVIATYNIPTWATPLLLVLFMAALVPSSSFLGHLCGLGMGYFCTSSSPLTWTVLWENCATELTAPHTGGLGYLKFLAPPDKALRWIEAKLNLLGRLPFYVSVDQTTYGRFGVIPMSNAASGSAVPMGVVGSSQKLGP
jgi:hypothetical protein